MTDCEFDHPIEDVFWNPATNEDGWTCLDCCKPGENLGYRPDFDQDRIERKTWCLLQSFHEAKLIYVSNGTMGEIVAENVGRRCRVEGVYDQYSILRFILEDPNMAGHADFWKTRAERHRLGAEPIRHDQEALPF